MVGAQDFGFAGDSAVMSDSGTFSLIALVKRLFAKSLTLTTLSDAISNPTAPVQGAAVLLWDGTQFVRVRTAGVFKDLNAVAISTSVSVWTPPSSKKFRLMGGSVSVSAAGSVLFEDNASGKFVFRTPKLAADTPYNFDLPGGRVSATAGNSLVATLSVSGAITGTIWGTEE